MKLGLGIGLSRALNPQVSGGIPGGPGEPPVIPPGDIIDDGGFQEPPIVVTVEGAIQFKGKKASGASGKFIYNIGVVEAGVTYTMLYDPDWSALANQGRTALVGFGMKSGNDFHLAGLKGDGAGGLLAYEVYGARKWNQTTGFSTVNGGAAANGTKDGPNWVRFEVSPDGATYTISTSADGESWDEEIGDAVPLPFSDTLEPVVFGIAVFLEAADAGSFVVDIQLWQESATEGGGLWTPAQLADLAVWYKGDDLVGVDGSNISQWDDASGAARHAAQGTVGNQPRISAAALNGMNVVNFTSNRYFNLPDLEGLASSGTLFFLAQGDADPTDGSVGSLNKVGGAANGNHWPWSDGQIYADDMATGRHTVGNPSTSLTNWTLCGVRSASNDFKYYINGTEFFSSGSNTVGFNPVGFLGHGGQLPWNGKCAEWLIVAPSIAAGGSDWQKVEGYLAHKWDTTSVLDSGHPYKNDPPTI